MQTGKVWRVLGSSVRGTSHIKAGLPCQDALLWRTPKPGRLIAAAADGAGTASLSEIGARIACETAVDQLSHAADLRPAFERARLAVLAEAERLKVPPRELACTLILLVATADKASALQIGDGATLLLTDGDELRTLTSPAESEYLNETVFLTVENALDQVQTTESNTSLKGIALFTDGLQMLSLKMPERVPHKPFFDPLFRFLNNEDNANTRQDQLDRFLRSPRISERADDDLTLLLAALRPG